MAKLRTVARESLPEQIYRSLRDALVDGDHEPADRLGVAALAVSLGISGTPVREAIFRLVSDGALEMSPGVAIRVPLIEPDPLREILFMRRLPEGAAAARAAEVASPADIETLKSIHDAFMEIAQVDARKASAGNRRFHFALVFALVEVANQPRTHAVVEALLPSIVPLPRVFHANMRRRIAGTGPSARPCHPGHRAGRSGRGAPCDPRRHRSLRPAARLAGGAAAGARRPRLTAFPCPPDPECPCQSCPTCSARSPCASSP